MDDPRKNVTEASQVMRELVGWERSWAVLKTVIDIQYILHGRGSMPELKAFDVHVMIIGTLQETDWSLFQMFADKECSLRKCVVEALKRDTGKGKSSKSRKKRTQKGENRPGD